MNTNFEGVYRVYVETNTDVNPLTKLGSGWRTVIVYAKGYKWAKVIDPYSLRRCKVPVTMLREFECDDRFDKDTVRKRLLTTANRAKTLELDFNEKLVVGLAQSMY